MPGKRGRSDHHVHELGDGALVRRGRSGHHVLGGRDARQATPVRPCWGQGTRQARLVTAQAVQWWTRAQSGVCHSIGIKLWLGLSRLYQDCGFNSRVGFILE